jgi:acyl-CoA thioesterase FadM
VVAIGRSSFTMDFEIVREGAELVCRAQIVYVNFDKATLEARPVPESVRRRIEACEGIVFPPVQ